MYAIRKRVRLTACLYVPQRIAAGTGEYINARVLKTWPLKKRTRWRKKQKYVGKSACTKCVSPRKDANGGQNYIYRSMSCSGDCRGTASRTAHVKHALRRRHGSGFSFSPKNFLNGSPPHETLSVTSFADYNAAAARESRDDASHRSARKFPSRFRVDRSAFDIFFVRPLVNQ